MNLPWFKQAFKLELEFKRFFELWPNQFDPWNQTEARIPMGPHDQDPANTSWRCKGN